MSKERENNMKDSVKQLMRMAGLGKQVDLVDSGHCPVCTCKIEIGNFTSFAALKAHDATGLCESCESKADKKLMGAYSNGYKNL